LAELRLITNVLNVVVIVLFVVNLLPGILLAYDHHRVRRNETSARTFFKNDFFVDETLPKPEIHWVHLDGMISLEMMERFFETPQYSTKQQLLEREFVIYQGAKMYVSATTVAMPALLSPEFYDNLYGELLQRYKDFFTEERRSMIWHSLQKSGIDLNDTRSNYEFVSALIAADYDLITRPRRGSILNLAIAANTHQKISSFNRFLMSELPELLSLTSPIQLHWIRRNVVDNPPEVHPTNEQLNQTFAWWEYFYTHVAHWNKVEEELSQEEARMRYDLYPEAYDRMLEVMFHRVDDILTTNPNAVIVLQADHGFHSETTQQFMYDAGYPRDVILDLMHSVFSAVRIPEQYGGLESPLEPRNITRELVNRFVGYNYTLLP